jgi:hypothetical protein
MMMLVGILVAVVGEVVSHAEENIVTLVGDDGASEL